jgi:hypothetical protein
MRVLILLTVLLAGCAPNPTLAVIGNAMQDFGRGYNATPVQPPAYYPQPPLMTTTRCHTSGSVTRCTQ